MSENHNGIQLFPGNVDIKVNIDAAEVVRAAVAPIEKLMDMVGSFCGTVGEPLKTYLNGIAEASAMDKKATVLEKHHTLPIQYESENFIVNTSHLDSFHQRMFQRKWCEEEIHQRNIEQIVIKAANKLNDEKMVDETLPDEDWIFRFFTFAQAVSSEKMQELWASILAGNVKNSRAFSIKSLVALHEMSQEEAKLFEKVCRCKVSIGKNIFIPRLESLFSAYPITYDDILQLSEYGLLNSSAMLSSTYTLKQQQIHFPLINMNYVFRVVGEKDDDTMRIAMYPFTTAGRELSQLCNDDYSEAETIAFVKAVVSENKSHIKEWSLYKVIRDNSDGSILYDPSHALCKSS